MTGHNRQFLATLASLGIATHRLDQIRDAARLHRQQLIGTSELYAVIEADDRPDAARLRADLADCNAGPGWYEVITPRATTCIAFVHEDGSLYLPEGDLTGEEFAFAAARGQAHRLVRADDLPAAGRRQNGAQQ